MAGCAGEPRARSQHVHPVGWSGGGLWKRPPGCVEASPVQASGPEALADIPVWRPEVRDQGVGGLGPPAVREV